MKKLRWSFFGWWLLALLVAAGFARLGFWQASRADEKREQIVQVDAILQDERSVNLLAQTGQPFTWVQGQGRFLPSPVILLDNQQRNGKVGVQTYGVLVPDEAPDQRLLVDLGWLPMDGQRNWPAVSVPQGTVAVSGLRTNPPAVGIKLGDAAQSMQRKGNQWLVVYIDTQELSQALGAPVSSQVLRLDPKLPMGSERDLALHINSLPPERHMGYAVQWWGLALTVLIVALVLSWRFRRRDGFD